MFDKETKILLNSARTLGNSGLTVYLEDSELLRLFAVVANDLGKADLVKSLVDPADIEKGYYSIPLNWFSNDKEISAELETAFVQLTKSIADFPTYFRCLAEIHKRRLKFCKILENQPLPRMEQIVPRSLLEFGLHPSETLASWLVWRKWIYDIDNRSAQETGYLFEPVLTASLGGVSYAASKSPVKRSSNRTKGRQVDCVEGKTAYEFKMRVTIAASGQGRFQEEIDFALDCYESGYTPCLLVLDPTPSDRLDDLIEEYKKYKGAAFVGDAAWRHIKARSGHTMAIFIEKYVQTPLMTVESSHAQLLPISIESDSEIIAVKIGDKRFSITRPNEEYTVEPEEDDQ